MPDTLHHRLRRLRWRIRRVLCVYGLSWVVAVVLGAALAVGLLDWLVHLDDPGVRLILGMGIVAAGAWVGWRRLIAPLLRPLNNVDLALRIERRFPGFEDGLASTVQFLEHGADSRIGSPDLQRHVVERTMRQVERVDVHDVVETRGVRNVVMAAVAIGLVAALVAGFHQVAAATALNRLLFPFAANPWPKTTELRLVDGRFEPLGHKLQMARDGTLEVFVENRKGALPRNVTMEYRFGDQSTTRERIRRATLRDEAGNARDVAVARIAAARGPIDFRAVGGDDREMPWHRLEVVPPPLVEELRVTLAPPAYTGRPVETRPAGVGHVQGLVGTQVAVSAVANKPLASAHLRIKNQPPAAIALSPDGLRFETAFEIGEPGVHSYWFDLKDRQGFENAEAPRYELRGIADLVPDVTIDQPATDLQVTPDAVVPLKVSAKDDLGLSDLWLRFKWNESEEPAAGLLLRDGADRPPQVTIEHDWPLSPLSLRPGMRVVFHAEATDDFDLGPPHVGRSIARTLTVVSPEAKRAEIATRQSELIDELDEVRNAQNDAHERIAELRTQLETAGELRAEDLDLLKRVELEQRQIASRLAGPVDGIESRTQALRSELQSNRLDDPELQRRLGQIAQELGMLRDEPLPAVERELTQARKSAQTDQKPAGGNPREPLASAERQQQIVLESLDRLLSQLSQWRDQRELAGDLAEMIARQQELNRESAELGRDTLTRSLSQLSPQERADLARLAERQKSLAERLSDFAAKLNRTREKLADQNSPTGEPLEEAADQLRRQATAGRMREAAEQLQQNRIGQATSGQQQALQDLQSLEETLQNRRATDAESLLKKLKQAEAELESLHKREEELLRKIESAAELPDPQEREEQLDLLRKEQQDVRDELARIERELRRLHAGPAADAAERAGSRMDQIGENLTRNADDPLTLQKEQERLEQDLRDDLEQARRELARRRRRAEERLARELLERIADELQAMIPRQQNVIDETRRLETERAKRGNWSRGQLKSLRDLVQIQRGLEQETMRLMETLKAAEVFALALEGAARHMQRAADRLDQRQTDAATVAAEDAARQRFVDLIEVLKTDPARNTPSESPPPGAGPDPQQPEQSGPQADAIPQLAQLKLLRLMQADLMTRTAELASGAPTADQQAELDALAAEQGKLADLARNLMEQVAQPFEAEPTGPVQEAQ